MKSSFLAEMKDRGYLNQCTDLNGLDELAKKGKILAYIGFDCTADSLHVGSLLQIMVLRLLQKHGHQPIILLGGGTTLIGDPSGKDSTRKILNHIKSCRSIKHGFFGFWTNLSSVGSPGASVSASVTSRRYHFCIPNVSER